MQILLTCKTVGTRKIENLLSGIPKFFPFYLPGFSGQRTRGNYGRKVDLTSNELAVVKRLGRDSQAPRIRKEGS